MGSLRISHRRESAHFSKNARSGAPGERAVSPKNAKATGTVRLLTETQGSALLEFAIALPLLVVFVVGIYDFSGAFNQKQKIEQAAQEGAIVAGAQPMSDIAVTTADPDSLRPVVAAVFSSLAGSGVLPGAGASCTVPVPPPTPAPPNLKWIYTISGCAGGAFAGDNLAITIDRGVVCTAGPACVAPFSVGTTVTIAYPYHWRFNTVIQLLVPGATYAATTQVSQSATTQNQM